MNRARARVVLALLAIGSGCRANLDAIHDPPLSFAVTTTGPWRSMMYVARTDSGVVVIDLGWIGAEGTLGRALRQVGAEPGDVRTVLLTHSHRDHIVGWKRLRGATFYMAAPEANIFTGGGDHQGLVPRLAEWLLPTDRPRGDELAVHGFSRDTALVLGTDTLRAFTVPGHTAGSAAYLFRGVLFVGDALSWSALTGFRPDKPIHSDDSARSRASVADLWARLPAGAVEWVCTAHARCARYTEQFADAARW